MFNISNLNLRPFMDELDSGGGGGEPAPSITDPTNNEPSGEPNSGVADPTMGTDPASQKAVQTPEQNAFFRESRLKADAAEKRAIAAEQTLTQRDKWISEHYGNQGITTWDQYRLAVAEQEKQEMEKGWRDQGYDTSQIRDIMKQDPEYQQLKQRTEIAERQLSEQQGKSVINSEIKELSDEYPDLKVKTLADMQALPNFEAIKEKAYKGMTLLEAYEAVNRAEIRQRAKEEGAQGAIRNIGSKAHLGTEKSGNTQPGKEVEISPDQMRVWRAAGYSEAEARKREAKYLKKK